ncbi:MAG: hypothetical protein EH225_09635 [Calditrichaeota bacterium]|nr:hypothetical protein [Calditrichota bacterium]RQW01363.1 MAG: hypothetical protein EH225_09635 [Calditrichota bacterium]
MDIRAYILKTVVIITFLFLWLETAPAQWYYSLSLEQEYNSNPFGLPEGTDEQISRFSMGIQKEWSAVSTQYFGSYINFYRHPDRNLYWHQLYLSGGEDFNWNISLENRLNRTAYDIYDYLTVRSGLSYSRNMNHILWRLGTTASLNSFSELPQLNNLLFTMFSSFNKSFATRTSFIGVLTFNYQYYLEEQISQSVPDDSTQNMMLSVDGVNQGGQGPGYGGGGKNEYYYSSSTSNTIPASAELVLSLRIAQSLMKYTGLAFQFTQTFGLSDYDRNIAGLIYSYNSESQIFDDAMGYDCQIFGAELTQLLPASFSMKLSGYYHGKCYTVQGIYIDAENYMTSELRKDIFRTVWFTLKKDFELSLSEASGMSLQLNYQWINNSSNSYWYDYKSEYISLVLQLDI